MESEDSAIRALGPLFKLTEVYIWEDGSIERQGVCLSTEYAGESRQCYKNSGLNVPAIAIDFDEAPEDAELIKQMGALGLPVSFRSNKETTYKINTGKRKGSHLKLPSSHEVPLEKTLGSTEASQVEIVSSTVLHDKTSNSLCCVSMLDQGEPNYCNIVSDSLFSSGEDFASSNRSICDEVNDGISYYLSNNVHGCDEFLGDIISDDENEEMPGTKNSDVALLSPIQSINGCFNKGGFGGSPEHICLEDSSPTYEEKHKKFCSDKSAFSQDSEVLDTDGIDSNVNDDDIGDWRVYWDAFYMRNYFYNIKTGTSTWDPPTGMELKACGELPDGLNVAVDEMTNKDDGSSMLLEDPLDEDGSIDQPFDGAVVNAGIGVAIHDEKNSFEFQDELQRVIPSSSAGNEMCFISNAHEHVGSLTSAITEHVIEDDIMHAEIEDPATNQLDTQLLSGILIKREKAKKKRARKKSSTASKGVQCQEILEEFAITCSKYWSQRYLLFSKFDNGIKMDEEGWYSVTPELIARHHASRCADDTIVDCFTGVGGNAIQFALRCKHVIAIDVDPKKIDYAYHNASIYGVHDKVDFIKGDFFVLAPKLKAGTVFLSPPWGGPDYAIVKKYNVGMLRPRDGFSLFNTAKKIARKIVMFLPRNVDINQLAEMCISAGPAWLLEVEKNFLNGRLKAITAYFIDTTVEVTNQT